MKFFSLLIFTATFTLATPATIFVLIGSLGDLAKKYLWAAIEENVWKSNIDIEIYGASRNSESEGKLILDEILSGLPDRDVPLDGLEEKFEFLLKSFTGGDGIISKSKNTISHIFSKLDVTGSDFHRKLTSLFEKVPKTSKEVKSNLDRIFETLTNSSNNLIIKSPETFSQLVAGVTQFVSRFSDTNKKSSDEIMSELSVFLKNSHEHISDLAGKFLKLNHKVKPFKEKVKYVQLKSGSHFENFCAELSHQQLIFYLSIPPSAYTSTSELISKFCKNGNQVKVAYEKPFGYNLQSAKKLFSSLDNFIGKENIFLIDHYLGKSITQQVFALRNANHDIESLLNNNHVSNININLLEEADCQGRTGYYDKSGVFRDMLQNHATELLTLVTADINTSNFTQAKVDLLQSLSKPNKHQTVVAQYQGYRDHAGHLSPTPTFASVLLTSSLSRWSGVPILLTSGKSQHNDRKEIVIEFKSGERLLFDFCSAKVTFKGRNLLPVTFFAAKNSYNALIKNVVTGNRKLLPDLDSVLASWVVWDHIINLQHNLLLYEDHKDVAVEIHGKFLLASNTQQDKATSEHIEFFNKALLVTNHEEHLYQHLVEDIIRGVDSKSSDSSDFHLALSGGDTILGVFKYLVVHRARIPWHSVHIWQVDERCDLKNVNAKNLQYYLTDYIGIDTSHVHLVPVNQNGCGDVTEYQHEFNTKNLQQKFDYVVLGLGADGHTASLFQDAETLSTTSDFSHIRVNNVLSPHRITITFDLINRSDWISILVTGPKKKDIIQSIKNGGIYPVSNVSNSHLTWFIDEILFLNI